MAHEAHAVPQRFVALFEPIVESGMYIIQMTLVLNEKGLVLEG